MSTQKNDRLKAARELLQEQLDHYLKGIAHYQRLADEARKALDALDAIGADAGTEGAAPKKMRGRKPAAAVRKGSPGKAASALPRTGEDFWKSLLTSEGKTGPQILEAAITKLREEGHTLSKSDVSKLKTRFYGLIGPMVKRQAISSSGAGRQRVFSL